MNLFKLTAIASAIILASCGGGSDTPQINDAANQWHEGPQTSIQAVTSVAAPTKLTGYTCGATCWTKDTGIHINWTQSITAGVTQNVIQRSITGVNGPFITIGTITKATGYVDKDVTSGVHYEYIVSALVGTVSSVGSNKTGITSDITLSVTPTPVPTPVPTPSPGLGVFSISSQGETKFLVVNWWRGDPAREGAWRIPGICTGIPPVGNCVLGARKTFRPQGFYLSNGMLWLEVPQYEGGVNTYDHYPLPIELVKNGCTFSVQHIRTHSAIEFPLNPPGLEILPHIFSMTQSLCDTYDPTSLTWVTALNVALDAYLGPDPAPYTPDPYPYSDPRTGKDPSQ